MLDGIEVLCHSSIRIQKDKIIYIDPFKISKCYNDADIIMVTHGHYDHFSPEDIEKVKCDKTVIIIPEDLKDKAEEIGFEKNNIITVIPNKEYKVANITFSTVSAYNTNKKFHPKENNWVGYILELNGEKYYIAGDTDITEENKKIVCGVAFVPIGGTYTMTAVEAAELINEIKPKIAVPIHYGSIVGDKKDAEIFERTLTNDIFCKILL